MELKPIYIPFENIFPNLVGFLSSKEDFPKHIPRIDQKTPYGQAHKIASAIDRKISNLHLIMHRIRINCGVNLLPDESYNINFIYLPIDFESFFVWLRIIMDQVASLTPLFYEKQSVMPSKSFHDQLKWFINDQTSFDKKYSAYLKSNLTWFADIRDTRDDAMHRHFWSYAEQKIGDEVVINRMRGNRVEQQIQSLAKIIGELYLKYTEFSKFYEKHFKDVLLKGDRTFEYHTSDPLMVPEYAASINYFIEKAGNIP